MYMIDLKICNPGILLKILIYIQIYSVTADTSWMTVIMHKSDYTDLLYR